MFKLFSLCEYTYYLYLKDIFSITLVFERYNQEKRIKIQISYPTIEQYHNTFDDLF